MLHPGRGRAPAIAWISRDLLPELDKALRASRRRRRTGGPPPSERSAQLNRGPPTVAAASAGGQPARYSHSMVAGGFEVASSTTRFTPATSLVIRVEIRANTSYGSRVQSAVIASSEETGRSTIGWP